MKSTKVRVFNSGNKAREFLMNNPSEEVVRVEVTVVTKGSMLRSKKQRDALVDHFKPRWNRSCLSDLHINYFVLMCGHIQKGNRKYAQNVWDMIRHVFPEVKTEVDDLIRNL